MSSVLAPAEKEEQELSSCKKQISVFNKNSTLKPTRVNNISKKPINLWKKCHFITSERRKSMPVTHTKRTVTLLDYYDHEQSIVA